MKLNVFLVSLILLLSNCKKETNGDGSNGDTNWPEQPVLPDLDGNVILELEADDEYVNVMANLMPRMPKYPGAKQKELIMNGYVADLYGEPIEGAYIGLRSPGTVYIAASATTNANGYYEMQIPLGGADIYAAGYTIEYGTGGRAAVSLYPTDGSTNISTPGEGVVKNFVLLSYGLADADERASRPWSAAGYFGGSIRFDYSLFDETWNPHGLPEEAEVELTLTPKAQTTLYGETRSFVIIRTIGNSNGNFMVNNIPIGAYDISARLNDGRELKMEYTGPYVSQYPNQGLQPRQATGAATLYFTPIAVEARAPNANLGHWRPVTITLELP